MNTDTGEIRYLAAGEKPKPNEILVKEPNPKCKRCNGKGSILDGNRKERRHNLVQMRYIPCPNCSGKK